MAALRAAADHYAAQRNLLILALAVSRRAWSIRNMQALARTLATLMERSASNGFASVGDIVAEQNLDAPAEGDLAPLSLSSTATDGRPLLSLLELAQTEKALELMAMTQVADAGRVGQGIGVAVRPALTGYTRYLSLPSCGRCAVLAGRVYRWSTGFLRHPRCFPAGTIVSGPVVYGASRRWYEGELVVLRTASGKNVSVTGNHPILTSQGWLPANLIHEGSDVISRAIGDRSGAVVVPDHDQMPARIEDLWSADSMTPFGRMPVSAEDFHGDGLGSGHVDVVLADGALWDRVQPTNFQHVSQQPFTFRTKPSVPLSNTRSGLQAGQGDGAPTNGLMGGGYLSESLYGRHFSSADQARLARASNGHASLVKSPPYDYPPDSSSVADGAFAFAAEISRNQRGRIDLESSLTRWDAPSVPFSLENRGTYASLGRNLADRLASDVQVDCVVEVRRVRWSGHVYNLTSAEGWYDANGFIVSNCDCVMIPTTLSAGRDLVSDPLEAFERGQVTGLSKADAQAIRDGADIGKVVNVRRLAAGLTIAGRVLERGGKPTPEGIYRLASDREDAIRLLRKFGFIL